VHGPPLAAAPPHIAGSVVTPLATSDKILIQLYICSYASAVTVHVQPISCYVTTLQWHELKELNKPLLMKISGRNRNVKVK